MPINTYDEVHAVDYLEKQRIELAKLRAAKTGSSQFVPRFILPLNETVNVSDTVDAPVSATPGSYLFTGDKTNQKLFLLLDRDVLDGSDNAHMATITGSELYVTGPLIAADQIPIAFDFDGSSDLTISTEADFDRERTDVFSISFWAKWTSASAMIFVSKMTAIANTGYEVGVNSSGQIRIRLINTATTNEVDVRTTTAYNTGIWRHYLFTKGSGSNAAACKLYVDGTLITLTTTTDNLTATILNAIPLVIGAYDGGTGRLTGQISDMQWWNLELSSSDATRLASGKQISKNGAVTVPAFNGFFDVIA